MGISGRLATFSLSEVLQILDRGRKTGLLTIQCSTDDQRQQLYYIWLSHGRIVGAASSLNRMGLLSMLIQRKWLSSDVVSQINQLHVLDSPLGTYLKNRGDLQAEQLKLLFHAQVLQRVCTLFKFQDGQFKFDTEAVLPKAEMTGLSISATEAILLGLRVLRDWAPLESKLPQPYSALSKPFMAKLTLSLDTLEHKVWELADGNLPLKEIATRTFQSLNIVQQVAFRLVAVGLVEEVAIDSYLPKVDLAVNPPEMIIEAPKQEVVTPSFLNNLLGFLRSKI